jgi:tight adherence protein C
VNLEFILSLSFGLGIAGVIAPFVSTPSSQLITRLIDLPLNSNPIHRSSLLDGIKSLANQTRAKTSARVEKALFELPEIIDLLVVSLRAGDGIYRSFNNVIPRCDGELSKQIHKALTSVEYGAAFGDEIRAISASISHPQISEFTNKVALALERGTPLAQMLSEQGDSVRAEIKNRLLRQAGRNETRMLIPLVFLILPVTVLFAIYPSLELLNFGFI